MDRKTLLIFGREFLQTVRRSSFIFVTLAFPLLSLLGLGAYQLISGVSKGPPSTEPISVGYVDAVGQFDKYTQQQGVSMVLYDSADLAKQALLEGKVKEYLVIPADYMANGAISRYSLEQEVETPGRTASALRNFLLDNLFDGQSPEKLSRAKEPMAVTTVRLDKQGQVASNQGGAGAFIVPYLLAMLLIVSIFSSSGFLLQGLNEEKQGRVMEVLLSSVSPRQLLTGKVLGLGAAGLVQIIVWLGTVAIAIPFASDALGRFLGPMQFPIGTFAIAMLYFVLGYLLFAMIMAGVGAISTTQQEGQQLSTIFTLAAVVPLWFGSFIVQHPGHIISRVLTLVPITAPITVMTRLGLAPVPAWEIAVSVALLIGAIVGTLFVSARMLRAFLLMYGKRPDMSQIVRVIREA